MSKFWKWFLGIVLALSLFAAGVCVGFMAQAHMGFAGHAPMFVVGEGPFEVPAGNLIPIGPDGELPEGVRVEYGRMQTYGPGAKFHGDMHRGGGFEHRGSPLMLLGGLIHLALFFGLVYGAYWLGRRNARIVLDPEPGTPTKSASASGPAPAKPAPKGPGKKIA